MKTGNKFGAHRVIEPAGALPQPAWKIDNTMEIYDNEILINVQTLNIDAASMTQIEREAGGDEEKIKAKMTEIVEERGKHHNPETGSGGMLIGTVEQVGEKLTDRDLKPGDKVATLSSLSLTPLRIDKIKEVNTDIDQVHIEGKAVLFESALYSKIPEDMEDTLALAALDVAGAAAQTAKLVQPGDTVFIIGAGGKSGLLCLHEAKKRAGVSGKVIGISRSDAGCERIKETGLADVILQGSATEPMNILKEVEEATDGELCDVTINNVNVPDTEMGSILPTKDGGIVYFFSMATSFTKAALGAEGVGKDVNMIIGNGYTKDHADITLEILRENQKIRDIFNRLYT
ncbi:L-erythro-3,5-diaminohexanoate dehydrogenase [Natranaerobius thermophilus]|uniref:L-erythro-3,5-diaminohexanoate dehydrogenase n=1 Tax=Natranaerobius thermophilus (strain ATCC BAA-1301 / DSM 18059 / JW/NM-WN-LF) TaxID=457570 RepID=B2A656_NATTJ|nr:L-erythro-3,5-diaminohexanoate dehydrogenase [Natranaerobius thermophilus]ACB85473.1 L-erythro-3,5-diaminohexanoate dehydrogenase [Natranaerobius thermophilus JW/NM-WN-LF]